MVANQTWLSWASRSSEMAEMNKLYYGDNLPVLRESIASESVDLIYLDPPFNSNASYNVLFKAPAGEQSQAQIEAFEDTWHWNESAEHLRRGGDGGHIPMRQSCSAPCARRSALGENDMMAYLAMMAVRLIELHRVLKSTGSLYLHCDPTASHYLKIVLDAIFSPTQFRNEIVWQRTSSHNDPKRYGRIHDTILYYSRADRPTWNQIFEKPDADFFDAHDFETDIRSSPRARRLFVRHLGLIQARNWTSTLRLVYRK